MCLSIEIWNKKFIIYLFLYVNSILMEIYIKDDMGMLKEKENLNYKFEIKDLDAFKKIIQIVL